MIKENISTFNKPFLLQPAGKDYLWGGHRLQTEYNKPCKEEPLAETWECSTHPDGPSMIVSGENKGKTLTQVLKEHPEYLGKKLEREGEFPILIKFIDAKKDLSVQVHPTDEYAKEQENGQLGKTEMWYVVDATPEAKLVHGFWHNVTKEQVRKSIRNGSIESHLQKVEVKKDDVFLIQAGVVHAIGAGSLIAEIQQNSNLTYRLYDYGRKDKEDKLRELHVEKALDVMELEGGNEPRQPMRMLEYSPGLGREFLCRCKYFKVKRYLLNTEQTRNMAEITIGIDSFKVLLCLSGCGMLFMGDGEGLSFFKGDCIFIPATEEKLKLHGNAKLLGVHC